MTKKSPIQKLEFDQRLWIAKYVKDQVKEIKGLALDFASL
jgi:hypothetical protein